MRNRQESATVAPTEIPTKLPIGSSSSSANDRASSATEVKVATHCIQTNKRLRVSSFQPNDDAWQVPTCLDALEPRLTEELCAADNLMAVEDSSSNSASASNEILSSRQQRPMQTSPSNNRTASDAPRKGSYKKIGAIEAARLQREGCDVAGMFLYRVSESRASSDNGRTRTSWILTDVNDCDLIDARFEVREVYPLKHRGPGLTF